MNSKMNDMIVEVIVEVNKGAVSEVFFKCNNPKVHVMWFNKDFDVYRDDNEFDENGRPKIIRAEKYEGVILNEDDFEKEKYFDREIKLNEICCECGRPVAWGSGLFANRVPECNTKNVRIEMGKAYPSGDFVCCECDSKTSDD